MDRFLSSTINRVDKKGRVSIPANFRTVLSGQSSIHVILDLEQKAANAGGLEYMQANLARLQQMDPFSPEYGIWSFCYLGDADEIKVDGEGRIILTDHLRDHTGITDEVSFVGLGRYFQLWEPMRFQQYREETRDQARLLRRSMGTTSQINSPASSAVPASSRAEPSANLQVGNKEQDT